MTKTVSVYEAKTQLSRLLREVEDGEEIVIARDGEPVALLSRVKPNPPVKRTPGSGRGLVTFHEGWDDPLPPELFEGGS